MKKKSFIQKWSWVFHIRRCKFVGDLSNWFLLLANRWISFWLIGIHSRKKTCFWKSMIWKDPFPKKKFQEKKPMKPLFNFLLHVFANIISFRSFQMLSGLSHRLVPKCAGRTETGKRTLINVKNRILKRRREARPGLTFKGVKSPLKRPRTRDAISGRWTARSAAGAEGGAIFGGESNDLEIFGSSCGRGWG